MSEPTEKTILIDQLLRGFDSSFCAHGIRISISCRDDENLVIRVECDVNEKDKLERIRDGGRKGHKSLEVRRSGAAEADAALLADVRAYRAKHPTHGRPAIARALLHMLHNGSVDSGRQLVALTKRIERAEKRAGQVK